MPLTILTPVEEYEICKRHAGRQTGRRADDIAPTWAARPGPSRRPVHEPIHRRYDGCRIVRGAGRQTARSLQLAAPLLHRQHVRNGASLHRVNWMADDEARGLRQSCGGSAPPADNTQSCGGCFYMQVSISTCSALCAEFPYYLVLFMRCGLII